MAAKFRRCAQSSRPAPGNRPCSRRPVVHKQCPAATQTQAQMPQRRSSITSVTRPIDEVRALFDRADADADGYLNLQELRVALSSIPGSGEWTDEEAKETLAEIDTDHDGLITFEEWRAALQGDDDDD